MIFLVLTLVLSCTRQNGYDAEGDFETALMADGKSVEIIGYTGSKWAVRIPPQIRKLPVARIGEGAFENKKISSVAIPNTVASIGAMAFSKNHLTEITIPDSVTKIEYYAFIDNQLFSMTLPANVDMGVYVFSFHPEFKDIYEKEGRRAVTFFIDDDEKIWKAKYYKE